MNIYVHMTPAFFPVWILSPLFPSQVRFFFHASGEKKKLNQFVLQYDVVTNVPQRLNLILHRKNFINPAPF